MKKNEELIGIVSDLGSNGEGVIRYEDKVVFVPYSLIGEKVKFKVLKVTSKCVYGKLIEVLTPAESRVRPKCPVFTKCGGCQLQHIKYSNQLKLKENNIKTVFKKVANLNIEPYPVVKGDDDYRYRNKLQLPVVQIDDKTIIGFYAENSHRVVEIKDCVINANWTKDIISVFNKYITQYNIVGYNEQRNSGDIREITVKDVKGHLIITVVSLKKQLKAKEQLISLLTETIHYPFSLYLNVNTNETNVIYGKDFFLLYGNPDYQGDMLGIKYKIGVQSFMQVNDVVCSKLYSKVRELIDADEETTVIDAYSGAGLMTALLAKNAKKAIGIEIIPEAVQCANELALINKLDKKIKNYQGKCEEILPDIIIKEKEENSKISLVLDPPRKGCDLKVIDAIKKCNIDTIVYVSCMPSTLARDVGLLCGTLKSYNGNIVKTENDELTYKISCVRPFDMFAQTKHVETVVKLERI